MLDLDTFDVRRDYPWYNLLPRVDRRRPKGGKPQRDQTPEALLPYIDNEYTRPEVQIIEPHLTWLLKYILAIICAMRGWDGALTSLQILLGC